MRAGRWTTTVVWLHAALFAAIAVLGYASPETLFGGAAWLPLARLAVLLFAATLASAAILLAGAAFWASARHVGVALIAVLAFDVQVPVLMFAQAASLEYLERELGVAWWIVPLGFLLLIAVTAYAAVTMRLAGKLPASG